MNMNMNTYYLRYHNRTENMDPHSKIYIPGHRSMAGSAIIRNLKARGYNNIITRTHFNLDPTNQQAVNNFFKTERPENIFLAAAKAGDIPEQIKDAITRFLTPLSDVESIALQQFPVSYFVFIQAVWNNTADRR